MAHASALEKLCRVCGKLVVTKAKTKYQCTEHSSSLSSVFSVDITQDNSTVHPQYFCHSCKTVINKSKSSEYEHKTSVFVGWCEHREDSCRVCQQLESLQKGGRPKKARQTTGQTIGRPRNDSPRYCMKKIRAIAPPAIVSPLHSKPAICEEHKIINHQELQCPICCDILVCPVELVDCRNVVCADCCCKWLGQNTITKCPCCNDGHLSDFRTIQPASSLILGLLASLCVICAKCSEHMRMDVYSKHIDSGCQSNSTSASPDTSLDEILGRSLSTPLTPVEVRLQSRLAKRSLAASPEDNILKIKTGGQPLSFVQVKQPRVESAVASTRSLRRRSLALKDLRERVSDGESSALAQLSHEIKSCSPDVRSKVLEEIQGQVVIQIPTEASLAMKADLGIPWSTLRTMRRWMKMWGISIAAEGKMRQEARELVGDEVCGELVPFSFSHKDGGEVIKAAAMAYIPDVWAKIQDLLEKNDDNQKGVHRLSWHNEVIPANEIWLKLGGDKGGGTFKFCFQLLNIDAPNSPENTCVIALFEAPDTYTNLSICLEQYKDQIEALQSCTWRGKKVRIFLCGDYEFLCRLYGLSGASGRHCCLWCLIKSSQLKQSPATRGPVVPRSMATICSDYNGFVRAGNNIKEAKCHNNVIQQPFFKSLPLSQVCPPGLHITLGIFLRLFVLLEDDCHKLDLLANLQGCDSGPSYERYCTALQKLTDTKDKLLRVQNGLVVLEQIVTFTAATSADASSNPLFNTLASQVASMREEKKKYEDDIKVLQGIVTEGFHKEEGPFVKALERALASFNVQRQAYYSGSFVGNHVHRTLKLCNIDTLCNTVAKVAEQQCPSLLTKASDIQHKFKQVFILFKKCHDIYDSNEVTDEEITQLESHITEFMSYYRQNFPEATVLPKMHMLEEHVIPWLREWHVGFGLMGEQGAESIHKFFNNLGRRYCSIPRSLDRLKLMLKEHLLHIAPANVAARPLIKKRKLINHEE